MAEEVGAGTRKDGVVNHREGLHDPQSQANLHSHGIYSLLSLRLFFHLAAQQSWGEGKILRDKITKHSLGT